MAPIADMLTVSQVRKQLNGPRMAKIRMANSNINQIAHSRLIQSRGNKLLTILLHPVKSTLVSRPPPSASSIPTTITHHRQVTHRPYPTPIPPLPERLDILRNLGSLGGLMRM